MPQFLQRPVTLLFLVATACVSLLLSSAEGDEKVALIALLFGQSFALGGWLVLGHAHRLLRGGVFVAGSLAIALLATIAFAEPPHYPFRAAWANSIGAVAVLAGCAAAMTLFWSVPLRWLSRRRREVVDKSRWQFPIAELFGWTIVVAVASAVMRAAEFVDAGNNGDEIAATLVFALVAALLMALLLDGSRPAGPLSMIIAAFAIALMFVFLPMFVSNFDREIATPIAGSYVYLALWIFVCRLDRMMSEPAQKNAEEPRPPRWDSGNLLAEDD